MLSITRNEESSLGKTTMWMNHLEEKDESEDENEPLLLTEEDDSLDFTNRSFERVNKIKEPELELQSLWLDEDSRQVTDSLMSYNVKDTPL